MTPPYDYDLFVIGAGSGGVRAARIAAGYGVRVGIAEKSAFGGTCVNVGCVPKKLMTYVAAYAGHFEDARGYGWSVEGTRLDWPTFIARKNAEIARLNGIYERMLEKAGVRIHNGAAEIIGPHSVRVGEETFSAERILIATGGKPEIPQIDGKEHGLTSDAMFFLPQLPKTLAIIGAGFIALEFAGIFAALGAQVHLFFRRDLILNEGFDLEAREFLQDELAKKGIHLHAGAEISPLKKDKNGQIQYKNILFDNALFAIGRTPNIAGLGLEKLGVELDKNGAVMVNEGQQTNLPSLYAVGDVTDRVALTPVALAEGHALVDRLYGNKNRAVSYENIPSAIFSSPPLSHVGLTEAQARAQHTDDIDIYKTDFRGMRMILANNEERTFMKLIVQRNTDRVLGLHMVGADAPEIVQGFATALIAGATKGDFDRTIGIHPTAAEEFVTMRTKAG